MKFVFRVPRRPAPGRRTLCVAEAIEPRVLLSATVISAIQNLMVPAGTSGSYVDLSTHFADPTVPGTLVQMQTSLGAITVALYDQQAPNAVNNFLNLAQSGEYNNTIFDRSLTQSGQRLVAGGSYTADGSHILTFGAIPSEASLSNVSGTIATLLDNPADPNSATSGFLFNVGDNAATLDPQGYTVFGQVVSGLGVVAQINALPTIDGTALNPAFTSLPVRSAAGGTAAANLVTLESIQQLQPLSYTVTSDNPSVAAASINGSTMLLNYGSGKSGYAHINVVATDVSGNRVSETFRVELQPSAARAMDVPLHSGQSLSFVDVNHSTASISFSGPGSAVVHLAGDGLQLRGGRVRGSNQEVLGISVTGTKPGTSITVLGHPRKRKAVFIGDITADGPLNSIRVKQVFVDGDLTVGGTVRRIEIDGAQSGTMTVGTGTKPLKLYVGNYSDENFVSGTPVSLVRSFTWATTDNVDEVFSAPYLSRLVAYGNFMPGLQLSGVAGHKTLGSDAVRGFLGGTWTIHGSSAPLHVYGTSPSWNATFDSLPSMDVTLLQGALTAPSMKSIVVHGRISTASLNFTAPYAAGATDLGHLSVRGGILGSSIRSAGNLGLISALNLQGTLVVAGTGQLSSADPLPSSASQFVSPASIRSISLHPHGKNVVGYLGSDVAASSIGSISMGTTRVDNSGSPFGVAAQTLGRLTGRDLTNKQNLRFSNITSAAVLAQQIAAEHLNLQDFAIRIV